MITRKIAFIFLFLSFLNLSYSQKYIAIDSIISKYPNFGDTEKLAEQIQKDFTTEYDKARAIYSWVALNIDYDAKRFFNPSAPKSFTSKDQTEIDREIKKYRDNEIKKTFRSKKGVCEDFSRLYEQIGTLSGLNVKVINGDAKIDFNDIGRKRLYSSHAWNVVEIDNKWILIDVTWGEGYLDYKTKTAVKEFTPVYFDTDPKYFYAAHFPESEYKNLKDKEVYLNGPLIYNQTIERDCEILMPKSGVVTANIGDEILFKIKNLSEFDDLYCFDNDGKEIEMFDVREKNKVLEFEILCQNDRNQFVTLYRHQKAIASFKIISKQQ